MGLDRNAALTRRPRAQAALWAAPAGTEPALWATPPSAALPAWEEPAEGGAVGGVNPSKGAEGRGRVRPGRGSVHPRPLGAAVRPAGADLRSGRLSPPSAPRGRTERRGRARKPRESPRSGARPGRLCLPLQRGRRAVLLPLQLHRGYSSYSLHLRLGRVSAPLRRAGSGPRWGTGPDAWSCRPCTCRMAVSGRRA